MALKFVVGLFESKGIAEDAINRLRYEGVPDANIFAMLMRETAPDFTPIYARLRS